MGCWGIGTFENDDAEEFLVECLRKQNPEVILNALNRSFQNDECLFYIENEALIAAEVVAAKIGCPSSDFPDDPEAWEDLKRLPLKVLPTMISLSLEVVQRIKKNSNLKEAWLSSVDETDYIEWVQALDNLIDRLSQFEYSKKSD